MSVAITSETMRKVVEEEGREARNLLIWSVPLEERSSEEAKLIKKPPTSPRPQSASPRPPQPSTTSESERGSRHTSKRCSPTFGCSKNRSRVRSASAGRNPQKDLRARYWAFLFENLHRAVDEIYQTCETDESIVESKEAIMMLENYTKEFRSLIEWLNISKNFESTPVVDRPTSLTWEVRKSSPGKNILKNVFLDRLLCRHGSAKRPLTFSSSSSNDPVFLTDIHTNDENSVYKKSPSSYKIEKVPQDASENISKGSSSVNKAPNIKDSLDSETQSVDTVSHGKDYVNISAMPTVIVKSPSNTSLLHQEVSKEFNNDSVDTSNKQNASDDSKEVTASDSESILESKDLFHKSSVDSDKNIAVNEVNICSDYSVSASNVHDSSSKTLESSSVHSSSNILSCEISSSSIASTPVTDIHATVAEPCQIVVDSATKSDLLCDDYISDNILPAVEIGELSDVTMSSDNNNSSVDKHSVLTCEISSSKLSNNIVTLTSTANNIISTSIPANCVPISDIPAVSTNESQDKISNCVALTENVSVNSNEVHKESSIKTNEASDISIIQSPSFFSSKPQNETLGTKSTNTSDVIIIPSVPPEFSKNADISTNICLNTSYSKSCPVTFLNTSYLSQNNDKTNISTTICITPVSSTTSTSSTSVSSKSKAIIPLTKSSVATQKSAFSQSQNSISKVSDPAITISNTGKQLKVVKSATTSLMNVTYANSSAQTDFTTPACKSSTSLPKSVSNQILSAHKTGRISENISSSDVRKQYHINRPLPQRKLVRTASSVQVQRGSAANYRLSKQPSGINQVASGTCSESKSIAKDPAKTGSSSSLSSMSSGKSWADKVKGSSVPNLNILNGVTEKNSKDDDDSEGWETVRGRTRSRNSPIKKVPVSKISSTANLTAPTKPTRMGSFTYSQTQSSITNAKPLSSRNSGSMSSLVTKKNEQNKLDSQSSLKSRDILENNNSKKFQNQTKGILTKSASLKQSPKVSEVSKSGTKQKSSDSRNAPKIGNDVLNGNRKSKEQSLKITKERLNEKKKTQETSKASKTTIYKKSSSQEDVLKTELRKKNCQLSPDPLLKNEADSKHIKLSEKTMEVKTNQTSKQNHKPLTKLKNDSVVNRESKTPSLVENVQEDKSSLLKENLFDDREIMELTVEELASDLLGTEERSCSDEENSEKELERKKTKALEEALQKLLYQCESDGALSDEAGIISQDEFDGLTESGSLDWYERTIQDDTQEISLGLTLGEQIDKLELELRTPGRALQMHEKLSSPFRKRSLSETLKRHEEKQIKAQELREKLLEEKAQHFKDIAKKVEEIKALKSKRLQKQRINMEQKLQRAAEKRRMQLQMIVRKAHDEKEKVNEIAFINTLEAQNKRHDLISKEKDHEARLQDIQEERQRKLEEKAAKEAAAEERRKVLEAERQARLLEMQEKRKLKDQKIEQQLLEKEKERQELANQKARERELRQSALNAASQAYLEELQKKIQQKQEDSARRHEENIEQIRQKAFELSVRRYSSNSDDAPCSVPYETKKICTLCNVLIGSEVYLLSHLRGKKHQEAVKDQHHGQDPSTEELESYNLKHIVDAPADKLDPDIALDKERQKALKKRCKKLRLRMTNRGLDYIITLEKKSESAESPYKHKFQKIVKDISKYLATQGKGPWDSSLVGSLERSLGELERLFEKCKSLDKVAFRILSGISILVRVLGVIPCSSVHAGTVIPSKSLVHTANVHSLACQDCYDNCHYVLFSNNISTLLDHVIHRLIVLVPDNFNQHLVSSSTDVPITLPIDTIAGSLMHLLGTILACLSTREPGFTGIKHMVIEQTNPDGQSEEFQQRVHDVISYSVSIGIVDKLSQYMNNVRGPIDDDPMVAKFLLQCMTFLTALAKIFSDSYECLFDRKKSDDTTQLVATFKVTELVGSVSLLYGMLLHSGAPSRGDTPPPQLPNHTVAVTLAALRMLNHIAVLDLQMLQNILGNEGLSLQLRHIASYLLWYCTHWNGPELLHEVILLVGYFTVLNSDNQAVIQAGQRPTVLQQLCSLPFQYFSDPQLTNILFPTLISCCFHNSQNKIILEQEMSPELLANYIEAHLLDIHQANLFPSKVKKDAKANQDAHWQLHARFPKDRWTTAKVFFTST